MKINTKTAAVFIVMICGVLLGAFWRSDYNPFQETSRAGFPTRTSEQLTTIIEQVFEKPGIIKRTTDKPMTSTVQEQTITWTRHEYTAELQDRTRLSNLIYELSEAINASGGEIFQNYFQAAEHQVTLVIGVGSFITHHIVLTWPPPVVKEPVVSLTPQPESQPETAPGQFRAAIVIDDIGYSTTVVQQLLDMKQDFTFSILPHLEKSREIATLLHGHQKEILLHQPMEPESYPNTSPGTGAIMTDMTQEQIRQIIAQNLQTVPFAVGVNNHMGSRLTTRWGEMNTVLQSLQERQLFFLDSRTTDKSVGYQAAQRLGLPSAQKKLFLDAIPERDFVKAQLYELAALAEQGQPAIAIGHPKEATLQVLREILPEFERRNIEIVRVSEFLK